MRQGPTPVPTRTPASTPGFDPWAGANPAAYWSFVTPIVDDVAADFGIPTVVRAGSRAFGSFPIPITMLAGWGFSLTPNVYKNFSNEGWSAFTGENLYVDLLTDSGGFVVTTGLGWGAGLAAGTASIPTGLGAIPAAGVADFTVAAGSSFVYDSWLGPNFVRPIVQSWLFGD